MTEIIENCDDADDSALENIIIKSSEKQYDLDVETYYRNNVSLKKYKLPELKRIAKQYKIKVTGTKPVLIDRIQFYFLEWKNAIKVQRIFRGNLVRKLGKLRGQAWKNRSICVNETDFYTLDPVSEIPNKYFFSYTDERDFTYGFDIRSLVSYIKQNGVAQNPYNREMISSELRNKILQTNTLIKIIFDNPKPQTNSIKNGIQRQNIASRNNSKIVLDKMKEIRELPLSQRIQQLFIEIDLLGFYTQRVWFDNLTIDNNISLLHHLDRMWNYRAGFSQSLKSQICPYFSPLLIIMNEYRFLHQRRELTPEIIKQLCVSAMENMIYTALDNESKYLGASRVLTCLTFVSLPARNSLLWLYESV